MPSAGSASFATGRLTSVSTNVSTTNYTGYDPLGRVTSSQQTTAGAQSPFNFSYTYNLAGALTSATFRSGRQVIYTYDAADRVDSACSLSSLGKTSNYTNPASATPPPCALPAATSSPTQPPDPITYAPHGAISTITLGNGLTESTQFNARLQPISIGAGSLLSLAYCYSPADPNCSSVPQGANNGNLQSQTISGSGLASSLTQRYTYDSLSRLLTFSETSSGAAPNQNYNYDAFGNRSISSGWMPAPAQTPAPGTFSSNQWTGASYDPSGNQTSIAGISRNFSYDAENRQTSALINNFPTTYAYDGDGRRVQKIVCPEGTNPCTAASTGAVVTTFVYDAQGELAAEYGGPQNPEAGVTYLTADHLGSTRLVTDSNANPIERIDYAPFGEELIQGIDGRGAPYSTNQYPTATLDAVTEKFTSKERDAETGLDFFESRYYSSAQGRFTSPDEFKGGFLDAFTGKAAFSEGPLPYADITDPQTLNKYAYVRNNPLRYTDPDRHCIEDLCIGEAIAVAAAFKATASAIAYLQTPQGQDSARAFVQGTGLLITKAADALGSLFTRSDTKPIPNPNGSKGAPDDQQTADEEAAKMGPNGQREVRVETPGGAKGARVIDAAKVENGKVTEATQIIRPNKNGTPPAREVRAAKDIEGATGVKPKLVPVRPLKEPE